MHLFTHIRNAGAGTGTLGDYYSVVSSSGRAQIDSGVPRASLSPYTELLWYSTSFVAAKNALKTGFLRFW